MGIPQDPFGRIALCLSGGGYRAAAFHLGALSFMDKVQYKGRPLREAIKIISTVSGGTITGTLYAQWLVQEQAEGTPFTTFSRSHFRHMEETDLVKEGLQLLASEPTWPPEKARNLINAFAQIYHTHFNEGGTLGQLRALEGTHLEEVVFNATEFNYGLYFRFQLKGLLGNYKCNLYAPETWTTRHENPEALAQEQEWVGQAIDQMRLGDIVAASSCFPSGFEPLRFPHDFQYPGAEHLQRLQQQPQFSKAPLGLMDGGIVDNQGINSVLRAEERLRRETAKEAGQAFEAQPKAYDCMIISDVSSPFMEPFVFSEEKEKKGWRGITYAWVERFVNKVLPISGVLSLLAALGLAYGGHVLTRGSLWVLATVLGLTGVGSLLAYHFLNRAIKSIIKGGQEGLGEEYGYYARFAKYFKGLPAGMVEAMLKDRIHSVVKMVHDVFMKQVRRLIYASVYKDSGWNHRRVSNLIYELKESEWQAPGLEGTIRSPRQLEKLHPSLKQPSDAIFAAAKLAHSMETTLWFTQQDLEQHIPEALVASGQFTLCFNLLEHLCYQRAEPGYEQLPADTRDALNQLFEQMLDCWHQFQKDPYFMVADYVEQ